MRTTLALLLTPFFLSGCTAQGWYDAFQTQQRRECERYPQQYEVQRCLEKVNKMTYDQYNLERDRLKQSREISN